MGHVRDQFVKHAALAEPRVGARLAGVRFQQAVHAEAFAHRAQQHQQGGGEGADQQQPVAARRCAAAVVDAGLDP